VITLLGNGVGLSNGEGSAHVHTLSNNLITANSQVNVHCARGTDTQGYHTIIHCNPYNGAVDIVILNGPGTGQGAWNGTLKLHFEVVN
jgi:hypothetical protein